jgi:acetyl/propionyl-CoA carboxylase alpha subunit
LKSLELEIDGKLERILASSSREGLWFHYRGETYFSQKSKSSRARKHEETSGEDIQAPMPGKITKVLVKDGQEVKAKQTLVVMEAMKMEYNLRANAEGKVKKVYCSENEQVVQDQLLVEFE